MSVFQFWGSPSGFQGVDTLIWDQRSIFSYFLLNVSSRHQHVGNLIVNVVKKSYFRWTFFLGIRYFGSFHFNTCKLLKVMMMDMSAMVIFSPATKAFPSSIVFSQPIASFSFSFFSSSNSCPKKSIGAWKVNSTDR